MNGIDAITAERRTQDEAWGPQHDDSHVKGELIAAAIAYLTLAQAQINAHNGWLADPETGNPLADKAVEKLMRGLPKGWPWDDNDWHPSSIVKNNLKKAGALAVAEWDRTDRAGF